MIGCAVLIISMPCSSGPPFWKIYSLIPSLRLENCLAGFLLVIVEQGFQVSCKHRCQTPLSLTVTCFIRQCAKLGTGQRLVVDTSSSFPVAERCGCPTKVVNDLEKR